MTRGPSFAAAGGEGRQAVPRFRFTVVLRAEYCRIDDIIQKGNCFQGERWG